MNTDQVIEVGGDASDDAIAEEAFDTVASYASFEYEKVD